MVFQGFHQLEHLPGLVAFELFVLFGNHLDFSYLRLNASERAAFTAQLDRIREDGWAHRENVSFVGNLDLSVPVGSTESQTVAALTIGALKTTPDADLFECLPRLRQCAVEISRTCGLT